MHQDETRRAGRPRPWPHSVRWGPSCPPQGYGPQFSAHICCGQMAGWIKTPIGRKVGLDPSNIVLEGDQLCSPSPKRGQSPQFSAHVYCGQTGRWFKMPLGTKVRLVLGHIFGRCLLWPNGRPSQLLLSTC